MQHHHRHPGQKAPIPQQHHRQQLFPALCLQCVLASQEQRSDGDRRDQGDQRPPRPAQQRSLDHRQDDQRDGQTEQAHAPPVDRHVARRFQPRDQPEPRQYDQQPHRQVDQEDGPPFKPVEVPADQHAAQQRPRDRAQADDHARQRECLGLLFGGKDHVHDRHDLRHHHRPADALQRTRADQDVDIGRKPAQDGCQREQPHARQEQPLASQLVPEASAGQQAHRKGQHIGRRYPFDLRLAGAKIGADRGQRDVDDADIDQVHEIAHQQQHGCGPGVDALGRAGGMGHRATPLTVSAEPSAGAQGSGRQTAPVSHRGRSYHCGRDQDRPIRPMLSSFSST